MKKFALAPLMLAVLSAFAAPQVYAEETALAEVTVTATREGQLVNETPATIGIIKEKTLRETKPSHPTPSVRTTRRRSWGRFPASGST